MTHDLSEAYQIADMVVLYEHGATTAAVSKNDLLWNPSSERVARLIGARNILRATIADASGDSIVLDWRGGRLEAARSPSHRLHARAGDQLAFFVRPEYVRLIRKNRPVTDGLRQTNLFHGEIVGERDEGTTWVLFFRLARTGHTEPGALRSRNRNSEARLRAAQHLDRSPLGRVDSPRLDPGPCRAARMSRIRNG